MLFIIYFPVLRHEHDQSVRQVYLCDKDHVSLITIPIGQHILLESENTQKSNLFRINNGRIAAGRYFTIGVNGVVLIFLTDLVRKGLYAHLWKDSQRYFKQPNKNVWQTFFETTGMHHWAVSNTCVTNPNCGYVWTGHVSSIVYTSIVIPNRQSFQILLVPLFIFLLLPDATF